MKKITIAVDGFSSCGKSTMAKDLARRIGYVYIDTGAMYRAVTLYCLEHGLMCDGQVDLPRLQAEIARIRIGFVFNPDTGRPDTYLNGVNVETRIRDREVSANVSHVATIPFVREAMVEQQRLMGKDKGVVMDGRDIGTTVFPDAELKVFVTADPRIRAQRRLLELQQKGLEADLDEVQRNIEQRDYTDLHREVSPLRRAADAILLDNSLMSIDEQQRWLLQQYSRVVGE